MSLRCGNPENNLLFVAWCSLGPECPPSELVKVSLGSNLDAGATATITMQYTGMLSPSQGVYRSSSFNTNPASLASEEKVILVTQLESKGARHMFPCVDEPSSKVGNVSLFCTVSVRLCSPKSISAQTLA